MAAPMSAGAKLRVAQKVRALIRDEKVDAKQAFATAMSMENSGRLEEGGVYKRAPKGKHAYANRAHANVDEGYND
jgi:hypothetical protein